MNTWGRAWQEALPAYDPTRRSDLDRPQPALREGDEDRERLEALGYVEPEKEQGTP